MDLANMTHEDLDNMPYRQLQKLAIENKIRGNIKSSKMRARLKAKLTEIQNRKEKEEIEKRKNTGSSSQTVAELACSYAALILEDDGIPVTADGILKIVKAANVNVDSYWPTAFAKFSAKRATLIATDAGAKRDAEDPDE